MAGSLCLCVHLLLASLKGVPRNSLPFPLAPQPFPSLSFVLLPPALLPSSSLPTLTKLFLSVLPALAQEGGRAKN